MVELWSNEEETEFGIKVAGELGFRAITCSHVNMMFERIVDCSTLGTDHNWSAILDKWVSKRYDRKVYSNATDQVAAKTHTTRLLLN
ncbi:MAG: hypothetical protein ABI347_11790 [Nitrososphaera sp.]|jgi:hypothetical protein